MSVLVFGIASFTKPLQTIPNITKLIRYNIHNTKNEELK